ncbi:MAG: hypothetical protein M0C28_38930 [Candidatus Moduliflexus flocculans]|nr:hypothetical protein [Candidatus Moduliflexus flocculans]
MDTPDRRPSATSISTTSPGSATEDGHIAAIGKNMPGVQRLRHRGLPLHAGHIRSAGEKPSAKGDFSLSGGIRAARREGQGADLDERRSVLDRRRRRGGPWPRPKRPSRPASSTASATAVESAAHCRPQGKPARLL